MLNSFPLLGAGRCDPARSHPGSLETARTRAEFCRWSEAGALSPALQNTSCRRPTGHSCPPLSRGRSNTLWQEGISPSPLWRGSGSRTWAAPVPKGVALSPFLKQVKIASFSGFNEDFRALIPALKGNEKLPSDSRKMEELLSYNGHMSGGNFERMDTLTDRENRRLRASVKV